MMLNAVEKEDGAAVEKPPKPRIVSFNRDVHVKRIGKPRESPRISTPRHETPSPQLPILRREPFTHLSRDELAEEAAKVVAQAGGISCSADPPDKFFSLPYRRKLRDSEGRSILRRRSEDLGITPELPVNNLSQINLDTSLSDITSKKIRKSPRNSLVNLFKRSDRDPSHSAQGDQIVLPKVSVKRSKSDVSDLSSNSGGNQKIKPIRKRAGSASEEYLTSVNGKKNQLTPIIEVNNPRDDYFVETNKKNNNTDSYKEDFESASTKLSVSQAPDIIISTPTPVANYKLNPLEKPPRCLSSEKLNEIPKPPKRSKRSKTSIDRKITKPVIKIDSKTLPKQANKVSKGLVVDEIDIRVRDKDINPIDIKKQIRNTISILEKKLKLNRNKDMVHSSQKPPDKLPLTKGQTVDPLVKILKEDRFSPPPRQLVTPPNAACHNNNQPFSYIRPSVSPDPNLYTRSPSPPRPISPVNKMSSAISHNIVYAEVKRNGNEIGNSKQTIHTSYPNGRNRLGQHSDEDEGLGYEENRSSKYMEHNEYSYRDEKAEEELYKNLDTFAAALDSPITPRVREFRSKYFDYEPTYANEFPLDKFNDVAADANFRGRGDGMDAKRKENTTEDIFSYNPSRQYDLSHRRALLESRIQSRRFADKLESDEMNNFPVDRNYSVEPINPMEATRRYVSETRKYYRDSVEKQGFMDKFAFESLTDADGKEHKSRLKYNPDNDVFVPISADRREFIDKMLADDPIDVNLENIHEPRKSFPPEPEYEPPSLDSNIVAHKLSPDEYIEKKYKPKVMKHFGASHDALDSGSKYVNMKSRHEKFGHSREHYASNPEIAVKKGEFDGDYPETFHNSLRRNKRRDEGPSRHRQDDRENRFADSGIENDYRKDSSGEVNSKEPTVLHWRRSLNKSSRNESDDEGFVSARLIASERQHTESNFQPPTKDPSYVNLENVDNYVHRERSIDDGSHYDPRIDRLDRNEVTKMASKPPKGAKKISGLEKMKQLFSRDSSKKSKKEIEKDISPVRVYHQNQVPVGNKLAREDILRTRYKEYQGSTRDESPKTRYKEREESPRARYQAGSRDPSPRGRYQGGKNHSREASPRTPRYQGAVHSREPSPRTRYQGAAREESPRARYREYRGSSEDHESDHRHRPSAADEVMRQEVLLESRVARGRRVDSPVDFDYSQRRRLATPSPSPSPPRARAVSPPLRDRRATPAPAEPRAPKPPATSGWFKSLDRLTRKKPKPKSEKDSPSAKSPPAQAASPAKNLRFFGDTDLESDPSVSRASGLPKSRPPAPRYVPDKNPALARSNRTLSNSAQAINSLDRRDHSYKSSSLTNLQEEHMPRHSDYRSERFSANKRNLHNISEIQSNSEAESVYGNSGKRRYADKKPPMSPLTFGEKSRSRSHSSSKTNKDSPMRDAKSDAKRGGYNGRSGEHRNGDDSRGSSTELSRSRQDLSSSRSDLKSGRRRKAGNGETGSADSSTEGDSSQKSQRSIVYLHATTVGDIPGPERISRGRSRDDVSSVNSSRLQPQIKTVSRSFSLLAPWRPRHPRESQDINYSQSQNGMKVSERSARSTPVNGSTLSHTKRKSASTRNLAGSRQDIHSVDERDRNPSLARRSKMATSKSISNSNSSLFRKSERPRDTPIRDNYSRDKDYNRTRSTEVLSNDSYSRHPAMAERERVSRSISMPKSPNKSAGWFKIKSAKKMDNDNRMR